MCHYAVVTTQSGQLKHKLRIVVNTYYIHVIFYLWLEKVAEGRGVCCTTEFVIGSPSIATTTILFLQCRPNSDAQRRLMLARKART